MSVLKNGFGGSTAAHAPVEQGQENRDGNHPQLQRQGSTTDRWRSRGSGRRCCKDRRPGRRTPGRIADFLAVLRHSGVRCRDVGVFFNFVVTEIINGDTTARNYEMQQHEQNFIK